MNRTTSGAVPTFARALLLGLALAAPVVACSRSTEPATRQAPTVNALVGTWELVRGCGGIVGECRTPDALNEPSRYVFRGDGIVEAYRDGKRDFTTNYQLIPPRADDPNGRTVLLIGLGPTVDPRPLYVSFPSADTLILDEGCCDRFAFEYRRVK